MRKELEFCWYRGLQEIWAVSERVLLVKIAAKLVNLNIIQVYAPTSDHPDEEVEQFYGMAEEARRQCKNNEITFIMRDLNAKVGEGRLGRVLGPFGLREKNERGERCI